ncbi:MAG: hypothetical protein ACE5E0_06035 [Terriglobia bacterium]
MRRYSRSVRIFGRVFVEKKEELVVSFIVTAMLLLFSASFMNSFENEAQPAEFLSIPAACIGLRSLVSEACPVSREGFGGA